MSHRIRPSWQKKRWTVAAGRSWQQPRMPAFLNLANDPAGVVTAFVGSLGVFVIHPGVDDHLAWGVAAKEQAVPLEEPGPEPVFVIVAERASLAVLRPRRILRDDIERQPGDRGQQS